MFNKDRPLDEGISPPQGENNTLRADQFAGVEIKELLLV
jgi:hypothetical protein